jgi:hypothetical protein
MAARQYTSIVDSKTLQGSGITSAGQTSITLNNITNLPSIPSGSGKTFTLVLAPDTSTEEIVTVSAYGSGAVVTIVRGQEGTTAQSSHPVGTIVKHMITARDLQEPQDHIAASASVHGITGSVVGTTGAQELTNKTLGSSNNIKSGSTLVNNGTISGGTVSGAGITGASISGSGLYDDVTLGSSPSTTAGTVALGLTAWNSWTPTLSWTLNSSTNSSEYKTVGKTVYFNFSVASTGTITPSGTFTFTLPVQPTQGGYVYGNWQVGSVNYPISASFNSSNTTATVYVPTATSVTANTALSSLALTSAIIPLGATTTAANRTINISGFYEVA